MNHWKYLGKDFTSLENIPQDVIGFVYKITNTQNGKFYIGKKMFFVTKKIKISNREKKKTGTTKRFKYVSRENDWKTYYGSCQELKDDINKSDKSFFEREILQFCKTKKGMTYLELKYQIIYNVLENNSYNNNILGKFYRKDIEDEIV